MAFRFRIPVPRPFILAILLAVAPALPAQARELTAAERASLPQAVETLRAALVAQDVPTLMALRPPLVVAAMAERMGMGVDELVRAFTEQTAQAEQPATVHSAVLDLAAAQVLDAEGLPYMLIPTEIVIAFPGVGTVRHTAHTLAFAEQGTWRMLRLGDAEQRALLRAAYPPFADADLPEGSVEVIER